MITIHTFWSFVFLAIGFLFASGIVGSAAIGLVELPFADTRKHRFQIAVRYFIPITIAIPLIIVGCLTLEFIDHGQALIKDATIKYVFAEDTLMWKQDWHKMSRGAHLGKYIFPLYSHVAITAHPITENPKVRSLEYQIEVRGQPNPQALVLLERAAGEKKVQEFAHDDGVFYDRLLTYEVKSLLYEFNEKNSKRLALFYNPLDDSQQTEFAKLAHEFMDTPLTNMGSSILSIKFDIGD